MISARDEGLIAGIGLSSIVPEHLRIALQRTEIVDRAERLQPRRPHLPARTRPLHRARHRVRAVLPARLGVRPPTIPCWAIPPSTQAAADLGRTPRRSPLAWTLSVAPNVLLIPGTSSVAHLEENSAVADIELARRGQDPAGRPRLVATGVIGNAEEGVTKHAEITRRRPSRGCAARPSASPRSRRRAAPRSTRASSACPPASWLRRSSGFSPEPDGQPGGVGRAQRGGLRRRPGLTDVDAEHVGLDLHAQVVGGDAAVDLQHLQVYAGVGLHRVDDVAALVADRLQRRAGHVRVGVEPRQAHDRAARVRTASTGRTGRRTPARSTRRRCPRPAAPAPRSARRR